MPAEPNRGQRAITHVVRQPMTAAVAFELARAVAELPLDAVSSVTLSLRWVGELDASGVASLVRVFSHLAVSGRDLHLEDVAPHIEHRLNQIGLGELVLPTAVENRGAEPARRWSTTPPGADPVRRWSTSPASRAPRESIPPSRPPPAA